MAIDFCKSAIDYYADLSLTFTKSSGIRGFPGSVEIWCMKYCMVYGLSKALCVSVTE